MITTHGKSRKDATMQQRWSKCKLKYRSCKLVVKGGKLQFKCTNSKNGHRCKRLKKCMKNKNSFKWYKQCKVSSTTSYYFNS